MITHLEGRLVEKTPTYAIIDCGGVGYMLHISLNTFSKLGSAEKVKLFSHLAIKEDAHTLYGFADESERALFRLLISVSGVGAATARMILSSLSPAEIQQAIVGGNVVLIKSVKGIGEKTAQRIIIDLRDKVGKEDLSSSVSFVAHNTIKDEALSALVMLGFTKNIADKAIDKVLKSTTEELSVEKIIKLTLKTL